jgi:transposase
LYRLPPGVERRLDGNALVAAVRYELEKLRCSAGGQIFTASVPAAAGTEKYTARARAVGALARYDVGLPWHRLAGCQARVGVRVPAAPQWEQGEIGGACTYPVCKGLEKLAAQGEGILQDDRPQRVVALLEENHKAAAQARAQGKAKADARTGRQTRAVLVQGGERRICLYYTGRRQAGENLAALLTKREPGRGQPLVMSDALSRNSAEETGLIRCQGLAQGRRKFSELAEAFPAESAVVVDALKLVDDPEAEAREKQLRAEERLVYHQPSSEPVLTTRQTWLAQQTEQRLVEPNSSLGKAISYLLDHWQTLTRGFKEPGAPLDNNPAARALQLALRQRKHSLFSATAQSADSASLLTSVIAPGVQAGVPALDYLGAGHEHRQAVRANPGAGRPWNYLAALVPS